MAVLGKAEKATSRRDVRAEPAKMSQHAWGERRRAGGAQVQRRELQKSGAADLYSESEGWRWQKVRAPALPHWACQGQSGPWQQETLNTSHPVL